MTENEIIENDNLYHYTTQEGLIGIIESNCLWATHYKFLNDYSEIICAKEKIFELHKHIFSNNFEAKNETILNIASLVNEKSANEVVNNFIEYFEKKEIYITSFCEQYDENDDYINENGLLSQWRAYGGNGGYAIIFNKNKLEELINNTKDITIELKRVIYSDDNSLNNIFNHYIESKESNLKKGYDEYCYYDYHIDLATRYKDRGFKEERELRIVANLLSSFGIPQRKFRCNNGEQVPYIELFGFKDKKLFQREKTKNLPIKKIIVGPHKDKEARATWLRIKLASIGRDDIEVTVSKIPFVGR